MNETIDAAGWVWAWRDWIVGASLQTAVLAVVLLAADLALRRFAWPRLRLGLHLLVLARLLVPPGAGAGVALPALDAARWTPESGVLVRGTDVAGSGSVAVQLAAAIWLAGVVVAGLGAIVRDRRARREVLLGASAAPERIVELARGLVARIALRRIPEVVVSDVVPGPIVFGGRRARVVLPRAMVAELGVPELRDVLLHELVHLRRNDPWMARLTWFLASLFWFHPLVWLVARRAAALRELCCDATVAAILRDEPSAIDRYRATLLCAAARRFDLPIPSGALGWSSTASLLERLEWLARPRSRGPRCERLASAAVIAIVGLIALPSHAVGADRVVGDPLIEQAQAIVAAELRGEDVPGCLRFNLAVRALASQATPR